jgi:hypothetical protein
LQILPCHLVLHLRPALHRQCWQPAVWLLQTRLLCRCLLAQPGLLQRVLLTSLLMPGPAVLQVVLLLPQVLLLEHAVVSQELAATLAAVAVQLLPLCVSSQVQQVMVQAFLHLLWVWTAVLREGPLLLRCAQVAVQMAPAAQASQQGAWGQGEGLGQLLQGQTLLQPSQRR